MTRRKRRWLLWSVAGLVVILSALVGTAWHLSGKLEPFVREQTIAYLERRFDGNVDLQKFEASMPIRDPIKVLMNKGRGARLKVKATGILLKQRGAREGYPLLKLRALSFDLDASKLFDSPAIIDEVRLEGLELSFPPKGERQFAARNPAFAPSESETKQLDVRIGRIIANGTKLVILPRDRAKAPLEFDLSKLTLESAGPGVAMKHVTTMKNAKPPGVINAHGTFGPFSVQEPGESPITGVYRFDKADLSVFKGIAGLLDSTGKFSGKLNEIVVDGETRVPDFRLPAAGNRMPLRTRFHAVVDGTNGNTLLRPVHATLGGSPIRCEGGVVRFPGENGKTVDLDCVAKDGKLDEFLRLAVRGPRPPMTGSVDFNVKIMVPPIKVPYAEKLLLSGPFQLRDGLFTNTAIQEKLDDMSRRARGKPGDLSIKGAATNFEGHMLLERQLLTLSNVVFTVEGAMVRMGGTYDLKAETVDFRGQVRTEARLSEMMKSRWKRIALKPVDPFFAKDGAGAQFDIAIAGPASSPHFGLEKKKKR